MSVFMSDNILDGLLEKAALADRVTICSAQPTSIVEVTTYKLGDLALTPGDGNGDFVIANGDANGRKVTLLAQNIPLTVSGTADHVVIDDGVSFTAFTCVSKVFTSGDTGQASAADIEVADAVAA